MIHLLNHVTRANTGLGGTPGLGSLVHHKPLVEAGSFNC